MENKKKDYKDIEKKELLTRINIINEIMDRFRIVKTPDIYEEDNITNYYNKKELEIQNINDYFPDLNAIEIAYILYLFGLSNERKEEIIINFLDTMNSILSHFKYYKTKNPNIKYNNSHFDNYLLKRYECSYIFTTYISESRELKIDNKLYFNYIPIECKEDHSKYDPEIKEKCCFAHNSLELLFHPFVYKKFKCFKKDCKSPDCDSYHVNNDGEPIDMESEVDFYSNEIENLKKDLASLNLVKKEKDNINQNKIKILENKKKKNDFIPTEFNPATYKIYKCPLGPICKLDNKLCFNYHGPKDKRRNPELYIYKAELCPNLYENNKRKKNGKCEQGDQCNKAHNYFEYFYHPSKFRKSECKQEDVKNNKYCKERLICPYRHETDIDCGEGGESMVLDPDLITDYYKSLMVNYEKSIDSEATKLAEIKKRYVCYKCGINNALDQESFFVDIKEKKFICNNCSQKRKNECQEFHW